MDVLIIGGKKFLGRALVDALKQNNHNITLFNRGKTNPELFPEIEVIVGDRDGEIENLGDRKWDVVIDTCGYVPRVVNQSVSHLQDNVNQYVFISSISVYQESKILNRDEDAKVIQLEDKETEDIMGHPDNYGGLKFLCEEAVRSKFDNNLIIRAGLIVGPFDPTNRFTYWPVRIRKGGDVLIPSDNEYPVQIIDVRDLSEFIVKQIESKVNGTFNLTGPKDPHKLIDIFNKASDVGNSSPNFVPIENEILLRKEVTPWMELPLWIPSEAGRGLMYVSNQKALDKGLTFRSLDQTMKDTLSWYDEIDGDDQEWNAGLASTKEKTILSDPR